MADEEVAALEQSTEQIEVEGVWLEFTRFNWKQGDALPREAGAIVTVRSGLQWGFFATTWTLACDGFQLVDGGRQKMPASAWN